jgi:hypothetical protein
MGTLTTPIKPNQKTAKKNRRKESCSKESRWKMIRQTVK